MRGRMCGDRSREGTEGRRDKGEGRGAAVGDRVCYLEELGIGSHVSPAEAMCLLTASMCDVTHGASLVSLLSPSVAGLQMPQASGLGPEALLFHSPPRRPCRP